MSDQTAKLRVTPSRASYLMRIAAEYIRKHAPDGNVHYDEADCDGLCLSDDLIIEANSND